MTIEDALARLALNTGRIADALEGLLAEHGVVIEGAAEAIPAASKKTAKKKKDKKKKGETVIGKTDPEDDADYSLKDIRGLLHQLQEQENQAAVKSMLKKVGASTLGQVDEKKYAQLAKAIEKILDD